MREFVVVDNRGIREAYYNENMPFWNKFPSDASRYETKERAEKIASQLRSQHAGRGEIFVRQLLK